MLKWTLIAVGVVLALLAVLALVGTFLPKGHQASRTITLPAAPDRIFAIIADVSRYPEWRPDVKQVEILPEPGEGLRFAEVGRHGRVRYRVEAQQPPSRWVTRIDDSSLPYGGSWTYTLKPHASGTSLTITEDGEIYNPIFRVLSRTVFSTSATIEAYQAALRKRVESEPPL